MCQSLWEYITVFGHLGWVVLIEILSGITGAYLDISGTSGFPRWLWLTLLGIGLIVIPFLAFHKVRKQRDELDIKTAKLHLSDPIAGRIAEQVFTRMVDGSGTMLDMYFWKVELSNKQVNSEAKNVRVQLVCSKPHLDFLPVDLHKTHNNSSPYTTMHNVVYGDRVKFDVASIDGRNAMLVISRSDIADFACQVDCEVNAINLKDGLLLKLSAYGSPPIINTSKWYKAYIDDSDVFQVVSCDYRW